MGGHEEVPADIAKTLVGWKKHFNSYTQAGRFNVTFWQHFILFFKFNLYFLKINNDFRLFVSQLD